MACANTAPLASSQHAHLAVDQFGDGPGIHADDRTATGHCFQHDEAEGSVRAGVDKSIG